MNCPKCGGNDIEYGGPYWGHSTDRDAILANALCLTCGTEWEAVFHVLCETARDVVEQQERDLADESYHSDLMSFQGPDGYTI